MMNKKTALTQKPSTSGGIELLPSLEIQRIPFSAAVDGRMRTLKARTGITPNILARLGFCLSLEEQGIPADPFQNEGVAREINRNTLLGQHDVVFVSLFQAWITDNMRAAHTVAQKEFDDLVVAHMNRGFELIGSRMRSLADLENIVPEA